MPNPPLPVARLTRLVRRALGRSIASIEPLAGGASTRTYHRIRLDDDTTTIAMFSPEGAKAEEATAEAPVARVSFARWPFLEVRDLLEQRGVRVPAIHGEEVDAGLVLLEDLGDVTLAEALRRDPSRREALYGRAVRDLVAMHRSLADGAPGTVVATRAFDELLLRWELAHFVEFGLDARGVSRSTAARVALDQEFDVLARDLASRPRGFVHRDYQSRNLLIDPRGVMTGDVDALVVIDFQDALLGPRAYDLVALMRDSYQTFDETFVDSVVARYADLAGLTPAARADFRDEFDRLTVQRKLKDAGRFVFIERKKGDPSFLPYYGPSLARVRRALERLAGDPALARVFALLSDALPDHFA